MKKKIIIYLSEDIFFALLPRINLESKNIQTSGIGMFPAISTEVKRFLLASLKGSKIGTILPVKIIFFFFNENKNGKEYFLILISLIKIHNHPKK